MTSDAIETKVRSFASYVRPLSGTFPAEHVAFTAVGIWRVYFNRHAAAPMVWCIAPEDGGWEIAVPSVGFDAPALTAYVPKATPDDDDGRPSAWFTVEGQLTVTIGGHASIGAP